MKTEGFSKDFFKGSTSNATVEINPAAIAFISNDNDKAVEINCTDHQSKTKWTARIDGYFQHAAALGKNLVVLVSTEYTFFTRSNSIFKAYLFNTDNGALIKEKVLFSGNNEYYTIPYQQVSKDKTTYTLATRETAVKRNAKVALPGVGAFYTIKKLSDQANRMNAFNVLTFDENLNEKSKISPILPDGDFIGMRKTINGDMYIAVSENKKGITISKYAPEAEKAVKSVTEPYSFYAGLIGADHLNDQISFYSDTINNNTVYISGSFKTGDDHVTVFNKYDFANGEHKRFKKIFTAAELKAMEKSYTPLNKQFKKLQLAPAKFLELADVAMYENGYFIILSDYRLTPPVAGSPSRPFSDGIIVYNLDKNLAVRTVSTIPRFYMGALYSSSMNVYAKNGALYVLASHQDNASMMVARINTASGKLEAITLAEPDKAGKSDYADIAKAVISDTGILLPVLDFKIAINKTKYAVHLYRLSW